ncbi:hypothetical protein L1887_48114 [Cichorium endivia]|nr:hypothetical protein L1887_48114 [Cichorium endivia]
MRDCRSPALVSRFVDIGVKILADRIKAQSGEDAAAEAAVGEVLDSLLRMGCQQEGFAFNATDADSCGHVLLHVIHTLEAASSQAETCSSLSAAVSSALHDGVDDASAAPRAALWLSLERCSQSGCTAADPGSAAAGAARGHAHRGRWGVYAFGGHAQLCAGRGSCGAGGGGGDGGAVAAGRGGDAGAHAAATGAVVRARQWARSARVDGGAQCTRRARPRVVCTGPAESLGMRRVPRPASARANLFGGPQYHLGAGGEVWVAGKAEAQYGGGTVVARAARHARCGAALRIALARLEPHGPRRGRGDAHVCRVGAARVDVIDLTFDDDDAAPVVRAEVPRKRRMSKRGLTWPSNVQANHMDFGTCLCSETDQDCQRSETKAKPVGWEQAGNCRVVGLTYCRKIAFCHDASSCVDAKFHLGDFLVDLFHELDDEIDELVLQHAFGVGCW